MKQLKPYLILCFFITYISWGTVAIYTQLNAVPFNSQIWMYVCYVLGVLAPAFAAIMVTMLKSRSELKQFIKNIISPSRRWQDYALLFALVLIFQLLPFIIFGGSKKSSLFNLIIFIPMFIIIGGLEEIGWRGFMLPKLLERFSLTTSSLFVGLVWVIWHIPLFFIIGTYQQTYLNFVIFAISTMALSLILSSLYINTRSIFMCIIAHALINSIAEIFVIKQTYIEAIMVFIISSLLFWIVSKPKISSEKLH